MIPLVVLICIPVTLASRDSDGPFLIYSPNKKYALLDIYRSSEKDSERFHIYFIDKTKNIRRPLLLPSTGTNSYTHDVDFLWSPDSSKFVVNDNEGPDGVDSFVYNVSNIRQPIVLSKRLENTLKQELGERNFKSLIHYYVGVKRWSSPKSVDVEVYFSYAKDLNAAERKRASETGGWPAIDFRWLYSWDLQKTFKKIRKLRETEFDWGRSSYK
jgi:hypothetical protein